MYLFVRYLSLFQATAAADYLEMSRAFHTIIMRDVPLLGLHKRSQTRRFITLVDTLYDNSVRLILSAAASPDNLFSNSDMEGHESDSHRVLMDDLGIKEVSVLNFSSSRSFNRAKT